ncbi:hypothetical protein ACM26W_12370 [Halomonas sp. HK25]|uniref:hypothetical protein n=1 Tax=Halomonas sp. HK25 TaxID=3394321 RepID=UPI0039FC063A
MASDLPRRDWSSLALHLALPVLALLLWSLVDSAWASWLFPPAWILATQLIAAGSLEAARLRRRAWLGQYLRDGSPWHHRLRDGVVMLARHQLFGALLALVLVVTLLLVLLEGGHRWLESRSQAPLFRVIVAGEVPDSYRILGRRGD